ncbi:hypothetical protein ACTA71_008092 [Dictyostelium dimigraforme]
MLFIQTIGTTQLVYKTVDSLGQYYKIKINFWLITEGILFPLPDSFRDNVQSYISVANVCFVKWYPGEQYQITSGESHRNYAALSNFGQRMDAIIPGNCLSIFCSK